MHLELKLPTNSQKIISINHQIECLDLEISNNKNFKRKHNKTLIYNNNNNNENNNSLDTTLTLLTKATNLLDISLPKQTSHSLTNQYQHEEQLQIKTNFYEFKQPRTIQYNNNNNNNNNDNNNSTAKNKPITANDIGSVAGNNNSNSITIQPVITAATVIKKEEIKKTINNTSTNKINNISNSSNNKLQMSTNALKKIKRTIPKSKWGPIMNMINQNKGK